MTAITVIVPVLARPQNAQPLVTSFRASQADARLVFVASPDDDEQIAACVDTGCATLLADWQPGPGDFARKTNLGYAMSDSPYVLCGADDLRFHPGWDSHLLAIAKEFDVGVVGTNDRANPAVISGSHATHPLVARCYIDSRGGYVGGVGKVYCPLYSHQWVDNELVETAKQRGCYAPCVESVVAHHHPIYDRAVAMDATYERGQADTAADRALFISRQRLWLNETVAA